MSGYKYSTTVKSTSTSTTSTNNTNTRPKSRTIGRNTGRGVSGTGSLGNGREDGIAHSGNWEADKWRREQWQNWAMDMAEMAFGGGRHSYGSFGSGYYEADFGYGGYGYDQPPAYIEQVASMIESANQATQTTLDDLDGVDLQELDADAILRFAFGPEDMATLDLNGEHDAIAEVRSVLTVNNPTKELMSHLIQTGQFKDVIWSGHGDEEGMWITNAEGQAELLPAEEVGKMFEGSGVEEVLLAACNGAGKVDDVLNALDIATYGYTGDIFDEHAKEDVMDYAQGGSLTNIDQSRGVYRNGRSFMQSVVGAVSDGVGSMVGMYANFMGGFNFGGLAGVGAAIANAGMAPATQERPPPAAPAASSRREPTPQEEVAMLRGNTPPQTGFQYTSGGRGGRDTRYYL